MSAHTFLKNDAIKYQENIWFENFGEITNFNDEFTWMIPDMLIFDIKSCVASPSFTFDQEIWKLLLMPSDGMSLFKANDYHWISLFLWSEDSSLLKKSYKVRVGVKGFGEHEIFSYDEETVPDFGLAVWTFLHLYDQDDGYSVCGRMKIFCRFEGEKTNCSHSKISEKSETEDKPKAMLNNERHKPEIKGVNRLIQNFESLLQDEWGSDIVLKTDDHEFKAHSISLRARSPIFAAMFQHEMVEKKTGKVDIADCSTAGFKVFLQYVYTGNASTMSPENVLDLYYIADKYQVEDLKTDCIEYMKNIISGNNFFEITNLALKHAIYDLEDFAVRFFCRNTKKIIKTIQWQNYLIENPTYANKLINKAVNG